MSGKKRTSKKKGSPGGLQHVPGAAPSSGRKGNKRRFKGHGPRRGIGRSMALARRAKREKAIAEAKKGKRRRRARNASASADALHDAAKRAEKAAFDQTVAAADSGGAAKPGKKRRTKKTAGKKRRSKKRVSRKKTASRKKATRRSNKAARAAARASKKVGKKKMSKVAARRRYRQGRAKTPKFKLMHKWGLPRRGKVAPGKKRELRRAAGHAPITFNQIMSTIQAEKLKGWVCVGPKRTGCGGGSKNLRGGHQIGIYATGHR